MKANQLKQELHHFLQSTSQEFNIKWMDKAKVALLKVREAQQGTMQNLKNIQDRNLQVNLLQDQTQLISETSEVLMENANKLKKTTRSQYYKALCIYISLALLALYILIGLICGFGFQCLRSN